MRKPQPVRLPRRDPVTGETVADSPVREPERSSRYLDHVRALPCCQCGREGPSDPHHVGREGMSQKVSDFRCVPLCRSCHRQTEDGKLANRQHLEFTIASLLVTYFRCGDNLQILVKPGG